MTLQFCGDLDLKLGRRVVSLRPAEAFDLAEDLIRRATRAIIVDEADRAAVREVVDRNEKGSAC